MNKLLIGLLLVAAGAGIYFLLKKKKEQPVVNSINKEWIIGKWKPESNQPVKDSAQPAFRYEFQNDGIALRSVNDTVKADTTQYEWSKNNDLVLKLSDSDSASQTFTVVRLTTDSLQLRSADSTVTLFTKLK